MVETKEEIAGLLRKMMEDLEGAAQTDEIYQIDMKNVGVFKVLI